MKKANQCRSSACERGGYRTDLFNNHGLVGAGNWNNDNRNVNLNENNLDNQNDSARFRPAVMDI